MRNEKETNWCEIFTSGTHKDSKGNEKNWTLEDLKTIKSNFENLNPDVPICVGHPKSNSPAYGWLNELKIEEIVAQSGQSDRALPDEVHISGDVGAQVKPSTTGAYRLLASFKQVQDEFKQAVNKGLFKTRSVSLTPDLKLRHLAFLGAQAPAIRGMEQFCFESAAGDDISIEFSNAYNFCHSEERMSDEESPSTSATMRSFTSVSTPVQDDKKYSNMEGKQMEQAQITALQKENADLKAQLEKQKQEAQNKDFEDFCDSAIEKGHILPAQKDSVINILSAVSDTNFNFSDEEINPVETFKDFISSLKQMDFSDVANTKNIQEDKSLDFSDSETILEAIQRTQADYKSRGIELNSAQALDIVKRQ